MEEKIIKRFKGSMIGVAPQGWLRSVGEGGRIEKKRWEKANKVLPKADFVIASEEDVFKEDIPRYVELSNIFVLTRGRKGAELYWDKGRHHEQIPAFESEEVDRMFLLIAKQFIMRLKAGCVSKEDQLNLVEAFHYRLAADNLERISDHTVKIANTFSSIDSDDDLPRDITDKIACVGRNSLDSVEKCIISLRRADVALAGSVLRENAKIRQSISEINQLKMDTSNALAISIITDSISRIGDYAGNIAELAIDLHQL